MDIQRGKLFERIAVFVLGPSAAGKTYMSRLNLPNVLVANHFPIVPFVTIDGGTMRDVSENWNDMKSKCPADGFSDLFSGFFKSETGRFKMRLFHSLCRHGVNMLIPDTFADWVPGLHEGKGMKMLIELAEQGYTVIMTAVRGVRARSARIPIISLEYNEQHCITNIICTTHQYRLKCTLECYEIHRYSTDVFLR